MLGKKGKDMVESPINSAIGLSISDIAIRFRKIFKKMNSIIINRYFDTTFAHLLENVVSNVFIDANGKKMRGTFGFLTSL